MNLRLLLIDEDKALPGRDESIKISSNHFVNDNRILSLFQMVFVLQILV